jgi:hypothetical protein
MKDMEFSWSVGLRRRYNTISGLMAPAIRKESLDIILETRILIVPQA